MRKTQISLFIAVILVMNACDYNTQQQQHLVNNDYLLMATLFHQKAAERDALCLQAYNIATDRLDAVVVENQSVENLAIVLDLDETVLDNSPYEAKCILENISYPTGWDEWIHAANAPEIPGSVAFLNHAKSKGVNIFYITNRKEKYRSATMMNLQKLGIAPASEANLLLRMDEATKEPRRQKVLENYNIVMLFGDNLADFCEIFDGAGDADKRAALVDSVKNEFGSRFIVLPNAMYGDWVGPLFMNDNSITQEEKIKKLKEALTGF